MIQMSKLKNRDRCLVTLKSKDGQIIETKIVAKPLLKIAKEFELKNNLDQGDQIIIESEEL